MAGMLPGVECARRRRLHGCCDPSSLTPSGFGSARIRLSKDTPYLTPTSFLLVNQSDDEDDKLGGAAKEAKQRLDGRLRGHIKTQVTNRENISQERRSTTTTTTTPIVMENSQIEIFGKGIKRRLRMGWSRKSSSSSKQDDGECAICLDQFKTSEKNTIPHLPCAHRFHSDCLLPWLQNNAHCPCCRAIVSIL